MGLRSGASFGPYEIIALLGSGGMGEVYRARDARLRRDVAIKVLAETFTRDPERLARFEREAQMLAALNCPNIAAIYGIEGDGATRGLVLELVEGPTLADRLATGALPIAEALDIARQIVDALDAAHERGIVHRDLKPANIKVTADGVVKVLDFGLAKGADHVGPDLSQSPTITSDGTRAGAVLGTAPYMSPEQARGHVVDKRTDVWAFGCVLYEMLAGCRAFSGATASDVIAAVLSTEPDWHRLPAATPPLVRRLVPRLIQKDLKRRIRDIADARVDLEEPSTGNLAPDRAVGARSSRAWRATAIASMVALLAVMILNGLPAFRQPPVQMPGLGHAVVSRLTNYNGTEAAGAIAPNGRSFVFVSEHAGSPDIWLRQVAGGDPVRLTNDAAIESELVYAADGESIYFTRTDGGSPSIWNILALGGQARRVINGAQAPSPSPGGDRLAWFNQESSGLFALTLGGIDGSSPRVLANGLAAAVSRASWSPDGQHLAYTFGALFTPRNLSLIDVATGRVRQVTNFTGSNEGPITQTWLPDNRHVVVTYLATAGALRASDLGVLDIDTGQITRLSSTLSDSFTAPTVSADGTRLIVTSTRTEREVWKVPFGADPIANGRAATRVLDASADPMWTFVTRDGRTLLFNNATVGSRNLWTMPLEGGERSRQITSVSGDAVMHSSLSPDGNRVAFASNTTGQSDIWVQNVDGSDLRQLTNDVAADAWPVWSPDGQWIVFSAGNTSETRRVPANGGASEKLFDGFFRGDWIARPDGQGSLIATSIQGGGMRLLDLERRTVLWQDRPPGNGMPAFSADAKYISHPARESRDRDAIWVYDVATGKSRAAVRFSEPFVMFFRASWVDDGRAFIVNRYRAISHIVMFDRFWQPRSEVSH